MPRTLYGSEHEARGSWRHPSGWLFVRTGGWGQNGRVNVWEDVDDVTQGAVVGELGVFEPTLREAVAELERMLADGRAKPLAAPVVEEQAGEEQA